MNFRRQQSEQGPDVNLTPLIDVVFLLLIFFMVSTTFNESSQLNIQLPEANGEQREDHQVLTLSIDAQGRYYLNRTQLVNSQLTTLKRVLQQSMGKKTNKLMISADKDTPYQFVVRAMDAARQVGINNFAIATKQTKK